MTVSSRFLQHAFSVGLAIMLCTPHALWRNWYALPFAATVFLYCLLRGQHTLQHKKELRWVRFGWLVFLGMGLLSVSWAFAPSDALRTAVFYCTGAVFVWGAAALFCDRRDRDILFAAIYAALILTSFYGLAAYAAGDAAYFAYVRGEPVPRLASTLEHGINYAEFIILSFFPAAFWAAGLPRPIFRHVALGSLLLPVFALGLTYSRTGYAAFGLELFLLWRKKDRFRWWIPVCAVFMLLLPGIRGRFLSMFLLTDASASGRFSLWKTCLVLLKSNWLRGIGLGQQNFIHHYLAVTDGSLPFLPPHSNMGYLEMFLSLGIVGGTAFLLFFFGVFPLMKHALRHMRGKEMESLLALRTALAGAALANLPEHIWFYPRVYYFWCVLYGLCLSLCVDHSKKPPDGGFLQAVFIKYTRFGHRNVRSHRTQETAEGRYTRPFEAPVPPL